MAQSKDAGLRRRAFLATAGLAGLLTQLGRPGRARAGAGGYGELVPDPDGILDLPPGFRYRVLERFGDAMDDGFVVPGNPDGMEVFRGPENTIVLMRNHELLVGDGPYPPGTAPAAAFDPLAMGCVTRVVLHARTFARLSSNLVLCGTLINCSGGVSPWGYLSCEETANAGHGYVFLCDPAAPHVQPPVKIAAYGRYKHEGACVDPRTNTAYLTEDRGDSALYRFVPDDPAEPFVGKLQALRIVGRDAMDASEMTRGTVLPIDWVDIDDPDPVGDTVRAQARAAGAAKFDRGEGITFSRGEVFAIATAGGPAGRGQIFRIVDHPQHPTIEALLVGEDPEVVDRPDNLAVAPWGEIFFGEDGDAGDFVRGVTPDGEVFDFARNALSTAELSGVCFSPDGRALFVNMYGDGMTLVITGPFPAGPFPDPAPPPWQLDPEPDDTTGDADTGTTDPDEPTPTTGAPDDASSDSSDSSDSSGEPVPPDSVGGLGDDPGACACRSADEPGAAALALALGLAALRRPD